MKLRRFYGNIGRKKFKRSLNNLGITPNVTNRSFGYFLESRLDVVLYRSNFFPSIYSARQFINHRKVYVNGFLVDKPGFRLNIDDLINLKNSSKLYVQLKDRLQDDKVIGNHPNYIHVNYQLGIIKLLRLPANSEIPFPFFMDLKNMTHNFFK